MPIHATAMIDESVAVDDSNTIGPGVIIEAGVTIGRNNTIKAYAQLGEGTTIGDDNTIHSGAIIGNEPQDLSFEGEPSYTVVGDRNILREYVTIHRGAKPGTTTTIGSDCFLMANAHIAHNCTLGNFVTMANFAGLAGHAEVGDRAFLSAHTGVHQFTRIGTLVMFSGHSVNNQDIPPYMIAGGRGAVAQGVNVVGLRRAGFDAEVRRKIQDAFKLIYRANLLPKEAAEQLAEDPTPEIQTLATFILESKRGIIPGQQRGTATPE